jgi:hypothetical protein
LKNQTQRVKDAEANARKNNKGKQSKSNKVPTPEERERAKWRALMKVDPVAQEICDRIKVKFAEKNHKDPLEFPFKNDRERIKFTSHDLAGLSIAEAFMKTYGYKSRRKNIADLGNNVPRELSVGDDVFLNILSVSKEHGVVFDAGSYKENFATRNNLSKYHNFIIPNYPVHARVIEKNSKLTMVDLIEPMIEGFISVRAKDPWLQNVISLKALTPIKVKDLKLVRGGYIGKAVMPNVSAFVGEDYMIDAFIPGSQIVLNATNDFEAFEGQEVDTFISSYTQKPGGRGMSLVCSRKAFLRHIGNLNLMDIHKAWCDDSDEWNIYSTQELEGIVTGVINSANKCGVFVEIPAHNITGMIQTTPEKLVDYKAGQTITVRYKTLEEDLAYNDTVGQLQHKVPFEIVEGCIKRVNIKPILEEVVK